MQDVIYLEAHWTKKVIQVKNRGYIHTKEAEEESLTTENRQVFALSDALDNSFSSSLKAISTGEWARAGARGPQTF